MKQVLIAALLAVCASAHGSEAPSAYCYLIAETAEKIVVDRDNGVSEAAEGALVLTWKIKPSVRSDLLSLIHAVYESGRPAKELSDAALKVCRVNQENRKN